MKVHFRLKRHILQFTFTAGTSRGTLSEKPTWFLEASSPQYANVGIGEISPLKGLSIDYSADFEARAEQFLNGLKDIEFTQKPVELLGQIGELVPIDFPTMRFGLETALIDLVNGGQRMIFPGPFFEGRYRVPINGLIWMGDEEFMRTQIEEKLKKEFSTIKMKIGAIDFETEYKLLAGIRDRYSEEEITLRVDANGAFDEANVEGVLIRLASLGIHSIEQPIAPGAHDQMRALCASGYLPIALDEELIGIQSRQEKEALLTHIQPQYIILKPSLLGGIAQTMEWIEIAASLGIGWWMTSMLESNIGLNAIAQLAAEYAPGLPQGLGTGQLYHNNIDSPLEIRKGNLLYDPHKAWAKPM